MDPFLTTDRRWWRDGRIARRAILVAFLLAAVLAAVHRQGDPGAGPRDGSALTAVHPIATFSIVAHDPETGDLGVAVQSKFFAVGAVVPYAAAGIGAVATQSYANTTFGPRGLQMLGNGSPPQQVIDALLADDAERDARQIGVIDAQGNAATFTGAGCLTWAGGRTGEHYAVQGNILAGPEVVDAMASAFEQATGDLASRMVAALAAGQEAGGDARGRQSAALLVVRDGGGYGGFDDRYIELRVDDHDTPIVELRRLLGIRHAALLGEQAVEIMQAAANAPALERDPLAQQAVDLLVEATDLDPDNGWHWMSLAAARLAAGDREAAATAGVRALQADPWIKTGILRGFGDLAVAEQLLEDEAFRRAWEAIRVSYRSP